MIVEIESYKGEVILYGKNIGEIELRKQIREIETTYDKDIDNFVELLCRNFGWNIAEADELPDYTYDRDTEKLYRPRK